MNGLKRLETITTTAKSLTDCWIWDGEKDPYGYGVVEINGKAPKAHRLAYEEVFGPIPPGIILHHTCDHRGCVNPSHLTPMSRAMHTSEHHRLGSFPPSIGKSVTDKPHWMQSMGIRLAPGMMTVIRAEAAAEGIPTGEYVRRALSFYLAETGTGRRVLARIATEVKQ